MIIQASEDLVVNFDPLNVTKSMRYLGGPTRQVYYADTGNYVPDRTLTPLTLQPEIIITDPHGRIATGDKAGSLATCRWYVGSIADANLVSVKHTDAAAATTPYVLGTNSSLIVQKNVAQQAPVTLIFEGEFYDTRRQSNLQIDMTVLLTTTSNSESFSNPVLKLDKPHGWRYNPLKGNPQQTITAQFFQQGEAILDNNVRYWWYIVEGSTERLIGTDELDFFYVSGQNTKVLTVDANYLNKKIFRCRAQQYTGSAPSAPESDAVFVDTKFIRRYPKSLTLAVNSRNGTVVHPNLTSLKFQAMMSTNEGEISNPDEYFFIRWLRNNMTAGSSDTEVGHGATITLSRNTAGVDASLTPRITAKAEPHGEYQALCDKEEDLLTDQNGEILVVY